MSDFKDFLAKVVAPIRADAKTQPAEVAQTPTREAQISRQTVWDEELEGRYVEVMNALLADAQERSAVAVFAEVVTWKLAVVAYHWGPRVTGDIVRRLGVHLGALAEVTDAKREADAAKEAGHRPN